MNAAACQYANECAHQGGSLPYTGFATGVLFAIGILLIVGGLFLRRDR